MKHRAEDARDSTTEDGSAPLLLTMSQTIKLLSTGRDSTYRLVHDGTLPHVRVGRRILIPRSAVEAWVQSIARGDQPDGG